MAEHAALYVNPDDPLTIYVVLDHGEAGIYELDLRDDHGEDVDEIPGDWPLIAELSETTATGRDPGRARHGGAR